MWNHRSRPIERCWTTDGRYTCVSLLGRFVPGLDPDGKSSFRGVPFLSWLCSEGIPEFFGRYIVDLIIYFGQYMCYNLIRYAYPLFVTSLLNQSPAAVCITVYACPFPHSPTGSTKARRARTRTRPPEGHDSDLSNYRLSSAILHISGLQCSVTYLLSYCSHRRAPYVREKRPFELVVVYSKVPARAQIKPGPLDPLLSACSLAQVKREYNHESFSELLLRSA